MRHALEQRYRVCYSSLTAKEKSASNLDCLSKSSSVPRLTSVEVQSDVVQPKLADRKTLASALPMATFYGCEDLPIAEVAVSAQQCQPGQLVTYRVGTDDPHQVVSDAVARGALGILTEQYLPSPLPQCVIGSVDFALAKIASARHGQPDRKLLTVGVLGAQGKTTTCLLAATLTRALGIRTAYQCDLGFSDGVVSDSPDQAVPVGAPLIEWIAESSDCCSRVAIVEIDEKAARYGHYDAMYFDVLIVTSRRDASDDFGPCGLACMLDRLTDSGIVIAPHGDTKTINMLTQASRLFVTYGTNAECEFGAMMIDQSGGMSTLMLTAEETSAMMETPLCGVAMAENIAAASALGGLLGHSPHEIAKHLATLRNIPGRGQRLVEFGQATVVIESGGSAQRVASALKAAKAAGIGGRVWSVLALGESESSAELARYGRTIERHAHHCVITTRPNQSASFLKRSHQLLDGVKECAAMRLVGNQEKAIRWAIESAGPRDTIVVILSNSDQTPAKARTEINQMQEVVAQSRAECASKPSANPIIGSPIKLKLFP